MNDHPAPPKHRYRLTLTVTGNTHAEVENELIAMTRGGYLLDSDHYGRDEWHTINGRVDSRMQHQNPDMTPEDYARELRAWARKVVQELATTQPEED